MEKICVAVRVRPPVTTTQEPPLLGGGTATSFWNVDNNRISLHKSSGTPHPGVSFSFDHVFDQTCPNSRVYELLTKDIINAAVEGFNGTVFAYGQTSSGKTFTMNGSKNDPGIIHRAIKDVFDMIQEHDEREFLIRVSYMEIYNEEINDLLVVHNQKLPIHESLERGFFVAGLREEIVSNAEQVHKLLDAGEVNRHFGETNMNVRSSRSHTIFRMVIESKSRAMDGSSSDAIRVSVLNLVDLAGSERIAKTGADGVRLKEGKHINKSLMVLGNVINKLSDGAKQRAHIPYRDSKLTRILQSALGGNAKTSIICTVAPEEVHAEETKGTLQFANRAKRVTNCAQVNEILSDAALLKRQTLEIEELRKKLEGSQAELLEQEILKLRNDLLKFALEREKLSSELEEERKFHRQKDLHMQDQLIKLDSLSNMVSFSDSDQKSYNQNRSSARQGSVGSNEPYSTPCIKAAPGSFVARRSNYSTLWECDSSPMPGAFNDVADEDEWMKLNKGFVADLDSLHMTPAVKARSLSSDGVSPCFSKSTYEKEIQKLKKQMELAVKERDEFEKNYKDLIVLNKQLTMEIVGLQEEAKLAREIPHIIHESVSTSKDIYKDVLYVMQSSVNDEKSFAKTLLSSMNEIGNSLFSTLESQCTMAIDGDRTCIKDDSLLKDECKLLVEKLVNKVALLASSEKEISQQGSDYKVVSKGLDFAGDSASWKKTLSNELEKIREKYICTIISQDPNNQILEDTKRRYLDLERQFLLLKEDKEHLTDKGANLAEKLRSFSEQKEMILEKYNAELQRRKDLDDGIKQFSVSFASRQRSLTSLHSDLKSRTQGLRSHNNNVMVPNSLGC